jgi:hypothetical protein
MTSGLARSHRLVENPQEHKETDEFINFVRDE